MSDVRTGAAAPEAAELPATTVYAAVVGGGVAGLAVTRMLAERGVPVLAFDENDDIAHTWRNRYDNLRRED